MGQEQTQAMLQQMAGQGGQGQPDPAAAQQAAQDQADKIIEQMNAEAMARLNAPVQAGEKKQQAQGENEWKVPAFEMSDEDAMKAGITDKAPVEKAVTDYMSKTLASYEQAFVSKHHPQLIDAALNGADGLIHAHKLMDDHPELEGAPALAFEGIRSARETHGPSAKRHMIRKAADEHVTAAMKKAGLIKEQAATGGGSTPDFNQSAAQRRTGSAPQVDPTRAIFESMRGSNGGGKRPQL